MHDSEHLGYDQTNDPGWLAPGAQKDTNTHIHLLEAFTALYHQSQDATVRVRLEEMVKVVATRIVQPSNYAHKEFYKDWRIHDKPVVSYGHDLELAWLLMDALEVLGTPLEPQVSQVALALGKHSADLGWDSEKGGYFEEGVPGGVPNKLEKVWWIQAEALPGLMVAVSVDRRGELPGSAGEHARLDRDEPGRSRIWRVVLGHQPRRQRRAAWRSQG